MPYGKKELATPKLRELDGESASHQKHFTDSLARASGL